MKRAAFFLMASIVGAGVLASCGESVSIESTDGGNASGFCACTTGAQCATGQTCGFGVCVSM